MHVYLWWVPNIISSFACINRRLWPVTEVERKQRVYLSFQHMHTGGDCIVARNIYWWIPMSHDNLVITILYSKRCHGNTVYFGNFVAMVGLTGNNFMLGCGCASFLSWRFVSLWSPWMIRSGVLLWHMTTCGNWDTEGVWHPYRLLSGYCWSSHGISII